MVKHGLHYGNTHIYVEMEQIAVALGLTFPKTFQQIDQQPLITLMHKVAMIY